MKQVEEKNKSASWGSAGRHQAEARSLKKVSSAKLSHDEPASAAQKFLLVRARDRRPIALPSTSGGRRDRRAGARRRPRRGLGRAFDR